MYGNELQKNHPYVSAWRKPWPYRRAFGQGRRDITDYIGVAADEAEVVLGIKTHFLCRPAFVLPRECSAYRQQWIGPWLTELHHRSLTVRSLHTFAMLPPLDPKEPQDSMLLISVHRSCLGMAWVTQCQGPAVR